MTSPQMENGTLVSHRMQWEKVKLAQVFEWNDLPAAGEV